MSKWIQHRTFHSLYRTVTIVLLLTLLLLFVIDSSNPQETSQENTGSDDAPTKKEGICEDVEEDGPKLVNDIYEIKSFKDLMWMQNCLDGNYKLMKNIKIDTPNFTPIGTKKAPFTGTLDGNEYAISNLKIERQRIDYNGLFGYISMSEIKNLTVIHVGIKGNHYTGVLAGYADKGSVISNVHAQSEENGVLGGIGDYIGGLIGVVDDSIVEGTSSVLISGGVNSDYIGGLVGYMKQGSVLEGSYSLSDVSGYDYIGGLVGYAEIDSNIFGYSEGLVKGDDNIGGIVGLAGKTTRVSGHSTGDVFGDQNVGGLVGTLQESTVERSYATGRINGGSFVGGLVGHVITNSFASGYSTSDINGKGSQIGGFVGKVDENSRVVGYSTGAVSGGGNFIGGLVGHANDSVVSGNSKGDVSGARVVGGLIGYSTHSQSEGYSTSAVRGVMKNSDFVGGLVGTLKMQSNITGYATGDVNGFAYIGGMVGSAEDSVVKGYSKGAATGYNYVGGLAGRATKNSVIMGYSISSLAGTRYVGGLVGSAQGSNNIQGYVRGSMTRTTGKQAEFGMLIGDGAATISGYYSEKESKLINISMEELKGTNGVSVAMSSSMTSNEFSAIDFNAKEWVWIGNGQWPAININAVQSPNVQPITLNISVVANTCFVDDADQLAVSNEIFQVTNWQEFTQIEKCLSGHFVLTSDITIPSNTTVVPLGTKENPFTGVFDGGGHSIKNISIKGQADYVGLFGYVTFGEIKNIVVDHDGISGKNYIGTLVGYLDKNSTITDVTALSSSNKAVSGTGDYVGGLVGYASLSTVKGESHSNVRGTNKESDYIGGIAGYVAGSEIQGVATGNISGDDYIGGLVGYSNRGDIRGYSSGVIEGTGTYSNYIGGIGGRVYYTVVRGYTSGEIKSGHGYVGGLLGYANNNSDVIGFSSSNVNGNSSIGGLVGYLGSSKLKGYSTGVVTGQIQYVGGLVGDVTDGTVVGFVMGDVIGASFTGGLVGFSAEATVKGYVRNTVKRISGDNNHFGFLVGAGSASGYYSTDDSKLNGISLKDTQGSNGEAIKMQQSVRRADFNKFNFSNNTWVWTEDGRWPAIYFDEFDIALGTEVKGDDPREQPIQ